MNYPRNIYSQFNDEKLEQVRTHPYYASMREETIKKADEILATEPPRIKFSKIHLYATTGNRAVFENDYFEYFRRLNTLFVAYLISDDEKYLPELTDTLWNILNFESWTLPAHISESAPIEKRRRFLALFSTRAGRDIAEIIYYIGDKLPELVTRRARAEVQYRVIDYFTENSCPFEHVKHNWAAVCIGSVLCTYLYLATDEEIEANLPRMMATADKYLDGYADDCCCSEGVGYWNYGFSNFLIFASMLKDYTNGKINYFENPKVKKIAFFPYRVRLSEKDSISFSDGSGIGFKVPKYMAHLLKSNYPDYPLVDNEAPTGPAGDSRALFWTNPDYAPEKINFSNEIFENVQWFIHHGKDYAVGAKAGHNDEFHNHNDVGSFILSKDDVVSFYDAGAGTYTKKYFAPETRYQNMLCSSRGHSVPIINGEEQREGNRGICEVYALDTNGHFSFDMHKAYVIDTLSSLKREFNCNDDYFTLTDTYEFTEAPTEIVERFVSREPITLEDGVIKSGNSTLVFDTDLFEVKIGTLKAQLESDRTINYVDLIPKKLDKNMSFTFKFM